MFHQSFCSELSKGSELFLFFQIKKYQAHNEGGIFLTDQDYMQLALELAQKGLGWTAPNPMVGAVIVKDGVIIGSGYHQRYGQLHAERNALAACSQSTQGATMYVTLEPCCHYGKTPPCTEAIIENGISRVVIGSLDPNPLVAGKGAALLRQHGIAVTEGVLQQQCDKLNIIFLHYIKYKTPYVVMKYAMTMDGKIATYSGKSKWITGEAARQQVQEDRHRYHAIMVGVGTVLADDPLLTCRLPDSKNPVRIICDTHLRTPLQSQIIQTAQQVPTILATSCSEQEKLDPYQQAGCLLLTVPEENGRINLRQLMQQLGARNIDSILLEGGSTLNWSALSSGIVHKVQVYLAPKLFGGASAFSPIAGNGVACPDHAYRLTTPAITQLGTDLLLESEVISCSQES